MPMKRLLLLTAFVFITLLNKAQTCATCSINVSGYDTTNYTINSGQTLCIDTTGNFSGNITLNGGSICNKGIFSPAVINFTNGMIDNYGSSNLPGPLILSNNLVYNNKQDAITNITGSITVNGGVLTNFGILNVSQGFTNNSGTINNGGILNCLQLSGTNTISNNGVINSN